MMSLINKALCVNLRKGLVPTTRKRKAAKVGSLRRQELKIRRAWTRRGLEVKRKEKKVQS